MILNPDLYYNLAWDFLVSTDNPEIVTRFMFSGKQSLNALKNVVKKAENVQFSYMEANRKRNNEGILHGKIPDYKLKMKWDFDVEINADLRDPYMEQIIRWTLSSTEGIEILTDKPLPNDVVDSLLKNPNFTKLEPYVYHLPTLKSLIKSRKFDYIKMRYSAFINWSGTLIDTKELKLLYVPLEKILKSEFIKTNSLIARYPDEEFHDSLLTMNISLQKVLQFLEFLNEKLPNLKFLKLDITEHRPYLIYDSSQGTFNILPHFIKDLVKYEEKLNLYNGKLKIKFVHEISFNICSGPREICEDYVEKLRKELEGFEYLPSSRNQWDYYNFEKSRKIKDNFELNTRIKLFGRLM
ncbi:hypothetical protein FO519_008992 [Halicephalobus sp. NKZ332]|nr:hypothetical protein FO519_008992 [Halicephalobus sp. NKZ332]